MKAQRKYAVGRKRQQHPYHPQPKPTSVQSAVGGAHQDSDSTATNERAKTDHQPSQKSSSAKNRPQSLPYPRVVPSPSLLRLYTASFKRVTTLVLSRYQPNHDRAQHPLNFSLSLELQWPWFSCFEVQGSETCFSENVL